MRRISRRTVIGLLGAGLPATSAAQREARHRIWLKQTRHSASLGVDDVVYRFHQGKEGWAFESAMVRGRRVAIPLKPEDSLFMGAGFAKSFEVIEDTPDRKEIRFRTASGAGAAYSVDANHLLPAITMRFASVAEPVCAWRTPAADPWQRGAWVTRGETATDQEGREVFVDASGRLIFGHCMAGATDTAYVIQAELERNIHPRGKTMQPTTTFFRSGRMDAGRGDWFGFWQIRLGANQPKAFSIVFDRDLGGRLHHVCERYFADAVDSQVDITGQAVEYDPYLALEKMPLRLSCPESLVPQYGWHMEEYFPGYAKAAYPYGEDSGIQTAAFLSFEGHATGRDWEKYFGQHVMRELPLWGRADGTGFFTERPGGWTRWAYNTDYKTPFPLMEGGNWTDSEHIYHTAALFNDEELKQKALALMKHDVHVKLNLGEMSFPPCWNPLTGRLQDHRDDWETTAGLAYCAEVSSQILYPETKDESYIRIANRITDWFARFLAPEERMNRFHPKVNTYHCFMGPIVRALVHRYERDGDRRFLEIAQDVAWVMILTLGTTPDRDRAGRSFTGVTCVGVRGCVDYDCAPNLCHEKDLAFLDIAGALLPHVNGPGYAKLLAMQRMVLSRDSWKDAFRIQEQRDLNLRTNYDNYARGMANLAFALNRSSDPWVPAYERLVPVRSGDIRLRRDIVLANGTTRDRETTLQIRFLAAGRCRLEMEDEKARNMDTDELERGIPVRVPANSLRRVRVKVEQPEIEATINGPIRVPGRDVFLSDVEPFAAQRGTGLPELIFGRDRSFRGRPLQLREERFEKGIGLAANTVLIYRLDNRYARVRAKFGVDPDAVEGSPKPTAYLTIFVDGRCRYTSGPTLHTTPVRDIDVDLNGGRMLVIRMSGNWDENGDISNDFANLADARMTEWKA